MKKYHYFFSYMYLHEDHGSTFSNVEVALESELTSIDEVNAVAAVIGDNNDLDIVVINFVLLRTEHI